MDGRAWWAAVHGVTKSRTQLSDFTLTFHSHALEKEMTTHSSVLAWRISGTEEPGRLPSMGSHRVGHDWSDLAAAEQWYRAFCMFTGHSYIYTMFVQIFCLDCLFYYHLFLGVYYKFCLQAFCVVYVLWTVTHTLWNVFAYSKWWFQRRETFYKLYILFTSVQSLRRVQLCKPMNRSMTNLPVHHLFPGFPQTHVHWVGDAIQPSHPLSSLSPPALMFPAWGSFPLSQLFASSSLSIGVSTSTSVLPMNNSLDVLVGSPCSPRDSQESSLTPQFKSINSSALSFLYSPTITSICDQGKNHSLD